MYRVFLTLLAIGGASAFLFWSENSASCAREDEQLEIFLECVKQKHQSDKSMHPFVKQVLLQRKAHLKTLKDHSGKLESLRSDMSTVNETLLNNIKQSASDRQGFVHSYQERITKTGDELKEWGKLSNESLVQLNNSHELRFHSIQANVTKTFEELESINKTLSDEMNALNDTANMLRANLSDAHSKLEKLRDEYDISQSTNKNSLLDIDRSIASMKQDIAKNEKQTEGIRGNLDASVKEVKLNIDDLNEAQTNLQTDFDETKTTMVSINEKATQLESTLLELNRTIETRTASVSDAFTKEIFAVKNSFTHLKDDHNTLKRELNNYKANVSERFKSFDKLMLEMNQSILEVSNKQQHSEEEIAKNRDGIQGLTKNLEITKNDLMQTNSQLDKLRNEYDLTKALLDDVKKDLHMFKQQHKTDIEQVTSEINKVDHQSREAFDTLDIRIKELDKNNVDSVAAIKLLIEHANDRTTEFKTEYDKQSENTKLTLTQLQNEDTVIKNALESASETLKRADSELETQVKMAREKFKIMIEEAKQQFEKDLEEERKKVNIILPNTFNKESVTLAAVIIIIIVIGNTVTIYVLFTRNAPSMVGSQRPDGEVPGRLDMGRSQRNNSVLDQLPLQPELTSSVCVISFDEEAQSHHRQLVADGLPASLQAGNYIVYHVVRQHQQILDMPYSKVYLMFVEFSERHVIIEERGLGLGDLKRTTYEAIMKLGGFLVIVYVRDPGSRRLPVTQRYNHDIDCVSSQPELSSLDQSGRFFSVYDKLTPYQKKQLGSMVHKHMAR